MDLLSLTAWQMLLGAIPLVIVAALTYKQSPVWTGTLIWALVYNVIPANAFTWVLWLYVLHSMRAGQAGLATLVTPIIGVLAAWIQLGERPGPSEGVGMGLIIAALCLTALPALLIRGKSGEIPPPFEQAP